MTGLPPFRIELCDGARREPGMLAFNVRPGADSKIEMGWLMAVARNGEIVFCNGYGEPPQDTRMFANGNVLCSQTDDGVISEMTRSGEIVRRWYMTGKWRDKTPPEGAVAIDVPLHHHTVNFLANGNFLLLGMEMRDYADWPASDTDPAAGRETATLVGDVVMEVTPGGAVVSTWHLLDILDPYRICYGSRDRYWVRHGFPGTVDWGHANCATHDARDDSILVSLRHQDCIVKFGRADGELRWILGNPANWKPPWSDRLLTPAGDVAWQFHQHDCSITPEGNILCFDNGNYRAAPFDAKQPPEQSYSRAVEFSVDEAARTVRQVWSYGDGPGERLFASYQGGAQRMPRTGNTVLTYGGVVTVDGKPADLTENGFCRARIVEVTPGGEVVFDMWIDGGGEADPLPLSVFRAQHFPPLR